MSAARLPARVAISLGGRVTTVLFQSPQGELAVEQLRAEATHTAEQRCQAAAALAERLLHSDAATEAPLLEVTYTAAASTHALVQGQPPRIALLATAGFTDVLRIGRQALPREPGALAEPALAPFDLADALPPECCLAVHERLAADGTVVTPLTEDGLAALREAVRALRVQAVAVLLLHSQKNPQHEQQVARALAELALPVVLSSEVLPVAGEFERASATVLAAVSAVAQKSEHGALQAALPTTVRMRQVQGDGTARRDPPPQRALLADVAAGLLGVQAVAAALAVPRLLSLGVSEALCVAAPHDGPLALSAHTELAGLPLLLPTVAVALRRVQGETAEALRQSTIAEGCAAVWAVSGENGQDPADYPLLVYGAGAGAVAVEVAAALGIRRVIIPLAADLLSAYGALAAPVERERERALFCEASHAQQSGTLAATLHELGAALAHDLSAEGHAEGARAASLTAAGIGKGWSADLRYAGQTHSLTLHGIGDGRATADGATDLVVRFHKEHQRRYGFTIAERPVELMHVRLRVAVPLAAPPYEQLVRAARACPGTAPAPTSIPAGWQAAPIGPSADPLAICLEAL